MGSMEGEGYSSLRAVRFPSHGGRLLPEMTGSLFPNENLFLGTVSLKAGSRKRTDRRLRKRMRVGSPKSSGALWPKVFSRKREVRGS
jgi:hypothetical protein